MLSELRPGGILLVTLNRPEHLNAITDELRTSFADTIQRANDDPEVRVIAVTGAGRAFCAGADLNQTAVERSEAEREAAMVQFHAEFAGALYFATKPTVALVNGPAAGGGLGLALAADFRIAAEEAIFVTAFSALGLPGDNGAVYGLERLVGRAKAFELLMFSPRLPASEAELLGIVMSVHPRDELLARGLELCERIAQIPTRTVQLIKENLAVAEVSRYQASLDQEARTTAELNGRKLVP